MKTDLFITTFGRKELFEKSLDSLLANTDRDQFNLTIVVDGGSVKESSLKSFECADTILWSKNNLGLGPSINSALAHISTSNNYFDNNKNPYICMVQDDVLYSPDWLEKLIRVHRAYSKVKKIGFASGHDAPEHPRRGEIKFGQDVLYLKDWIRATNMLAEREYFLSMMPIPRIDPETGRERGKPNNGMGSSCDWHFIRNNSNSVCKTGRTNIVYPGLIKHIGFDQSTWLDRPLPENK